MSETMQTIIEKLPMLLLVLISIAQFIMIIIGNKSGVEKLEQKKQKIINQYLKNKAKTDYKLEKVAQKINKKEQNNNVRNDNQTNNGRNEEN